PVEMADIFVGDRWLCLGRRWCRRGSSPTRSSEVFQLQRCFAYGRRRRRYSSLSLDLRVRVPGALCEEAPEECKDPPGVACGECLIQQLLPYYARVKIR